MRHGFSLLELSIVLVIIGLLSGGILGGQALIKAAELRSITVDAPKYISASLAFRDKYFTLAGDMNNATSFWSKGSACGGTAPTGVCDGDGDGKIESTGTGAATVSERAQFWNQLALAGMIEGSYTGVTGPSTANGGTDDQVPGLNIPKSKINNGGWSNNWVIVLPDNDGEAFAGDYGNWLSIGGIMPGVAARAPLLKPEDAWNIDTKMDDGKPGNGKIFARFWNNACALAQTNHDPAAVYNLSNTSIQCSMYFIQAF